MALYGCKKKKKIQKDPKTKNIILLLRSILTRYFEWLKDRVLTTGVDVIVNKCYKQKK